MQSTTPATMESDQQHFYLKMTQEFAGKLNLSNSDDELDFFRDAEPEFHQQSESSSVGNNSDEDDDEEEFEFSFAAVNPDGSPIAADAIFHNGQIRPIYYPLFDQSLLLDSDKPTAAAAKPAAATYPLPPLRKLFVSESEPSSSDPLEGVDEETYCAWNGKSLREVASSPEICRKSSSTGFSKRWRFRDLVHRSSSDGKDAFVFLNTNSKASSGNDAVSKEGKFLVGEKVKREAAVPERKSQKTAASAHERHYVRNRAVKESDRRKSYLPYRQDLVGGVGFFVNVNGMSKNLHPY